MRSARVDDVELISIKIKSLQDVDIETQANVNIQEAGHTSSVSFTAEAMACNHNEGLSNVSDDERDEKSHANHYESSVRFVVIQKSPNGACGFHLTRSKWDPYPWVSAVDSFTPAAKSDLKAGDCVLEVNGCDVLGLRITEIAKLVKSSQQQVTLLLWSSSCSIQCPEESLCAAPMPRSLQRLSLVVQMVLSLIECPVCLDTITPPAMQCQNGHLLCVNCRIRAEKCPVCRDRYFPRPALIAEQIQSAITSAFNLCRNEDKVRQKIFGRHSRQRQLVKATLDVLLQGQQQRHQQPEVHKSSTADTQTGVLATATTRRNATESSLEKPFDSKSDRKVIDELFESTQGSSCNSSGKRTTCNKLLKKVLNSKACSMQNLINGHNNNTTAATTCKMLNTGSTAKTSAISQPELLDVQQLGQTRLHQHPGEHAKVLRDSAARQQQTSSVTETNQFNDLARENSRKHQHLLTHKPSLNTFEKDLNINPTLCCRQMPSHKLKHFSSSSDGDATRTKESTACLFESSHSIPSSASSAVCETSYASIPRAIKLKKEHYKQQRDFGGPCHNDVHAG